MKHKLNLILLAVCIAIPFAISARDFQYTYQGQTLVYTVLDEDAKTCATKAGTTSSAGNNVSGDLVIPPIAKDGETEYSVTSIGNRTFEGCSVLTSVSIPNSVTSIGNYAFDRCSSLKELTFEDGEGSLTLGYSGYSSDVPYKVALFYYCPLEKLYLGRNLSYETDAPFKKKNLASVIIGGSVTYIDKQAFYCCSGLTSVIIPNSVTSIGDYAFYGCYRLTTVTIPNSVTEIGNSAFSYCYSLTSVTIPNSVTSIGSSAFFQCYGLTSVTIPNSVISIGEDAFSSCTGLTKAEFASIESLCSINFEDGSANPLHCAHHLYINGEEIKHLVIPDSVTSISNYAFYGCSGLTSVTIPNSVTFIGNYAFFQCYGLTSVTIPNSVTSIGNSAFEDCNRLTSVTIPNSVTSIGSSAFRDCTGLTDVTIGNSVISIGDGAFYRCYELTSVTIPNSVTSIGQDAFYFCEGLTEVTIGNSVKTIGDHAFFCSGIPMTLYFNAVNCTKCGSLDGNSVLSAFSSLQYIYIGDEVTNIPDMAFSGSFIYSVSIPNSVKSIGKYAFYDCHFLNSVKITNSITKIGDFAFCNCTRLTNITIPNSVISIGSSAFKECTALKELTIEDGEETLFLGDNDNGEGLFYDAHLEELYLGRNLSFANTPFNIQTQLAVSVKIGNSVTSISNSTFKGNKGLTSITIPSSVTSIGSFAFKECTALKELTIEDGEETLSMGNNSSEKGMFYDSPIQTLYLGRNLSYTITPFKCLFNLTSVIISNSVTSIGERAFLSCTGLTEVTIPNSVTSIGERAFDDCSGLAEVTIPNSVTSIGDNAFYGCKGLTSLTIPYSVTSIGGGAFAACNKLMDVYYDTREPTKADFSCFTCYSVATLYVSKESVSKCKQIDPWKRFVRIKPYVFVHDTLNYEFNPDGTATVIALIGNQRYSGNIVIPSAVNHEGKTYTVTSIGNRAFERCSDLTSVSIANSVTSIGSSAFSGCYGLSSVTIPNSVTSIGEGAFYGCLGLTSLTIPNSVISIGEGAFYGCSELTEVTIGKSVETIGDGAFANCENLKTLLFNAVNCTKCGSLDGNTAYTVFSKTLENIYIGDEVTNIPDLAFSFNNIKSISIPTSVKSIGNYAFYGCSGLQSASIPGSVSSIGDGAFYNCTSIETVYYAANKPIEANFNLFSITTYDRATLYVPEAAVEKCKLIDPWQNFNKIEVYDFSGVEDIENDAIDSETPCEVYNLNGVKIGNSTEGLKPGLYIVRKGASTSKVMVK